MFSSDTCSWCLQSQCNGSNCAAPEESLFFTQTNYAFCEEILPLVKNAKRELPMDSNEPLSPQQFHFQDSYWGRQNQKLSDKRDTSDRQDDDWYKEQKRI